MAVLAKKLDAGFLTYRGILMFGYGLSIRLDKIEDKLEKRFNTIERLTTCLEAISEKIRDLDKIGKERIGVVEQDIRVLETKQEQCSREMDTRMSAIEKNCVNMMAKCPRDKVSRFEWLIFATCLTTMGGLLVAVVVAYVQYKSMVDQAVGAH